MSVSSKEKSQLDGNQTLQSAYNDVDKTVSVNGFLVGKVGHKITMTLQTTTVTDDTELYAFFDGSNQLYEIEVIYTDGSRETILSAERVS